MSNELLHAVEIRLAGDDQATLLRLVSTLHRRGVHVLEANLIRPAGRPTFDATFLASKVRASLVAASFDRLVEVLDVSVHAVGVAPCPPVQTERERFGQILVPSVAMDA